MESFIPTYWVNPEGILIRHFSQSANEDKSSHAGIRNPLFFFKELLMYPINLEDFNKIFPIRNVSKIILIVLKLVCEGENSDFKYYEPKKGNRIYSLVLPKEHINA